MSKDRLQWVTITSQQVRSLCQGECHSLEDVAIVLPNKTWLRMMLGVPDWIYVDSFISGYHDEYLPSVYGGRINGEKVGRQHKKGWCEEKS